jgi:hypothetical protein
MRRSQLAQFAPGGPVSLPGAFDGAAEHVTGDDGKDDGVAPNRGVQAVLRDEVEQPLRWPPSPRCPAD